jgi:hypothetical protein
MDKDTKKHGQGPGPGHFIFFFLTWNWNTYARFLYSAIVAIALYGLPVTYCITAQVPTAL